MSSTKPMNGNDLVFTVWSDTELHPAAIAALTSHARLVRPDRSSHQQNLLDGIDHADAVLAGGHFELTEATVRRAPKLKAVARLGAGFDNIDVDAASRHGICITHTPDAPTRSTAEFAVGLMVCAARRIKVADQALNAGRMLVPSEVTGFDLSGRTLGVVGLGRIGGRVAQIAQAFGMRAIAYDPGALPERARELGVELTRELPPLLHQTDVLSIHVPLNAGTRSLIGEHQLAMLRPHAIVINVSRGPIIDTAALVDALDSGHLTGAAVDVWDTEPPDPTHPLLHRGNVIATPHIAAMTQEGKARSSMTAVEQILSVLRGERPAGLLNRGVWPHRRVGE